MNSNQDQPGEDGTDSLPTRIVAKVKRNPFTAFGYALVAAFFLFIGITSFPFFQGLGYFLTFGSPMIIQWTVVGIAIAVIAHQFVDNHTTALYTLAGAIIVLGVLFGPAIGGVQTDVQLANQADANAETIAQLPNTSTENSRALPRSVADNYAQSSSQFPKYGLSESDITFQNGSYKYSYAIEPDNPATTLLGNQRGAMFVDMGTVGKEIEITNTTFKNGRGQSIVDSYRYQSVLENPLQHHKWDTTFNVNPDDGPAYIAHSTVTYDLKFALTPIPQVFSVPELGSVQLTYANGTRETLTPEEAADDERLEGQNYYPYGLSVRKVKATQYSKGILNKWTVKEGVLSIAELPEGGNEWPLVVPLEKEAPNPTYFIATEPVGSGNGVFEIWTVDGKSGDMSVRKYDSAQIGPQKAVNFVENVPEVNRLSNAEAIAPVPIVSDGSLYWHTKVVPSSDSGVVYTAFVSSDTGEPTVVEGTTEIYRFLSQAEASELASGSNQSTKTQSGSTMTVVVTNEEGEITGTRNITVPDGGGIEIDMPSNTD